MGTHPIFESDSDCLTDSTMSENSFLFTSESVGEGHPDKICDQISDAILDAHLEQDPRAKVACETFAKTGYIMVGGEINSNANVNYQKVIRDTIKRIGYDSDEKGLNYFTCAVQNGLEQQSPDIAQGVHENRSDEDVGAGDQGLMFGYATDETEEKMPLTLMLAHKLNIKMAELRKSGEEKWIRPDSKTQVTIEHKIIGGAVVPVRVHTIVISVQHADSITNEEMRSILREKVVNQVVPAKMLDDNTIYHIQPSGRFVIGGPQSDAGLTGRKIIVDTYGGWGAHGGGAFSGKDYTKVDRSAAYICRQMAKSVVKSGLAKRCLVQLSYAIGGAKPLSLFVETYGSECGKLTADDITNVLKISFDCRPGAIAQSLALREPKYQETAAYCHFGREPHTKDGIKFFEWENAKDLSKFRQMTSAQVTAELRSSNYLTKWVD